MLNKSFKVKVYSDSGHSWAAVKRSVLNDLDIMHLISRYSYQRGQTVYLEEDCDFPLFVIEMCKLGYWIEHISRDHGTRSVIRSYERFSTE